MDDIEVLKHAQRYVESMANGINPLTGEMVAEDDLVNNVRISRCLFYVNDKLKGLIEGVGRPQRKKKEKEPFVYDQSKIDLVKIEDKKLSLSVILRNIDEAYGGRCNLTYHKVAPFLVTKGVLVDNPAGNPRQMAAPGMELKGVWSETVMGTNGEHLMTYFNAQGQKLVLNLLKDFPN